MDEETRRIAGRCGLCASEISRLFAEAQEAHERIREDVETMYRVRESRNADHGETLAEQIKRKMAPDYPE